VRPARARRSARAAGSRWEFRSRGSAAKSSRAATPASGPSLIPTAIAWLRATTGDGTSSNSSSYRQQPAQPDRLAGQLGVAGGVARREDEVDHRERTSGLPDYVELLMDQGFERHDATTQEQAVRALSIRADLQFASGSRFRYSGSDYLLLAEIVYAATGSTLPLILTQRVFEPLELDMTMDPSGHLPGQGGFLSPGRRRQLRGR
jgi:hypothetical protein